MMVEQSNQRKPGNGANIGNKIRGVFTSNLIVAFAGVIVALVLGIGQWRLQDIGAKTAQYQALASLSIALGDEKEQIRRLAARGLARFGKAAIPTLLMSLEDTNKEVRSAAIDTTLKIFDLHQKEQGFVIEQVEDMLKETGDKNAIEASVLILLKINPDNLIPILEGLTSEAINNAISTLKQEKHLKHLKKLFEVENLSDINLLCIISAIGDIPCSRWRA